MVILNQIYRFRIKKATSCGRKHKHKAINRGEIGYWYKNDIENCCNCGNDKWKLTHIPPEIPIGMGNWDDRFHIQCTKCLEEKGVWELNEII